MKLLVFSDSHGDTDSMSQAVERERPDQLLHLGDMVRDAQRLSDWYPELPLVQVCGNCDGWCDVPDERLLHVGGRTLLLTHGHSYRVKSGLDLALSAARSSGADILLFGHTHLPLCDRQGALWMLNPGTIRGPLRRTYGVIEISGGRADCRIGAV